MQMFLFAVWLGCVFALLPSGLAHAQFDLEQEPVTYESLDTYDDTSLFELKIDHRAKEDGKKRHIMVNKNNPDEWIAFTYDSQCIGQSLEIGHIPTDGFFLMELCWLSRSKVRVHRAYIRFNAMASTTMTKLQ